MTRFIYLADTHLGTDALGYQKQQAYPGKAGEIFRALEDWIKADGGIDFILHGGDMADVGTPEAIRRTSEMFQFSLPVYLCLGNHDLTEKESLENWLKLRPELFPGGRPEYTIETDDGVIHVVPNHWNDVPYYWPGGENLSRFFPDQLEALDARCRAMAGRTQIILTHSPVFGLPGEQTGFPDPLHPPGDAFTRSVVDLVEAHRDVRCVLGAHNHMNMRIEHGGVHYVTASAFIETPFEFKLFEVGPGCLRMKTLSLADLLSFPTQYNAANAYVQGRECDRAFD